jgi:hypothetical protein
MRAPHQVALTWSYPERDMGKFRKGFISLRGAFLLVQQINMDYLKDGFGYIFGLVKISDKSKDAFLGRAIVVINLLGNCLGVFVGIFIASVDKTNLKYIFSVMSGVYISLFIFKSFLYMLIYIFFGKHEKVMENIKKALILNTLVITIGVGLMMYFASLSTNGYMPKSFKPDETFKNDGSLTLINDKVEKNEYSSRFTASIKNNSQHSLQNVIVKLLILEPSSSSCEDKVIDTIKFETLKYDDYKTLDKDSVRGIQYDFGFSESNYPDGWKYCTSVLGGYILK